MFLTLTYLRPIEAFAPELEVYRPMVWLSCIAAVASMASVFVRARVAGKPLHFALLLTFVVAIFASLATKMYFGAALSALSNFSPSAALFVFTLINVNSMKRLKIVAIVIAACTLVLAIWSINSYHTGTMADRLVLRQNVDSNQFPEFMDAGSDLIPAQDTSGRNLWRIRSLGFLTDPNDFGQAIVMALPLLMIAYQARRWLRNFLFVMLPSAVFLYAIYLTHSRGALLGVAAVLLTLAKRRLSSFKFGLVLFVIGFVGIAAKSLAGGRSFSADEESAGGRIDAWSEGLTMLFGHPLFGVGYGKFIDHHNYTAHNTFVLCFAELGLLGYFAWIALVVWAFKGLNQILAALPAEELEHRWVELLRTSLVGFLVCAFFLSRTYVPNLYVLLALCICAVSCVRYERLDFKEKIGAQIAFHEVAWVKSTLLAVTASIAFVYVIVRLKNADIL